MVIMPWVRAEWGAHLAGSRPGGQEDEARRREWEQKPPKERITGRLLFWIEGRRRKGTAPTEAEIAAKRAELLAELAGAGAAP